MATGRQGPLEEDGDLNSDAEFVGTSVRELREARTMTLQALSARSGLSVGHLSQIERGLSSPSVGALQRVAEALGVTVGWFFRLPPAGPGDEAAYIVRADARRRLRFASGITDELLSPHLAGDLEMLLSRFAPGAASGEHTYTHRGEEAGLVLSGSLEIWIGGERFELAEGDSFSFPSTRPHRYRNPGSLETVVIWVITPPTF
jgi:transcriptional regulator with XRE-family HTH domain